MEDFDLLVIGGGAAGMSAAASAANSGRSVLLVEGEPQLGGVLNQCFHNGFGEGLTGPAYARRLIRTLECSGARIRTGTSVLRIDPNRTALLSSREGLKRVGFRRCVLAAGCRERTLASLPVAGSRPAGVFTAGTAQRLMNLCRWDIGDDVVILGSGDIGQIMARQLTLAGKRVVAVIEQKPRLGGLARNRRECLEAFQIPVILRATVDEILGDGRIRGVMVRDLSTGQRRELPCGTLLTALGLIPDRELCRPLMENGSLPDWLRLCGNCNYVHDIVESVTKEAAAMAAAWEG